MDIFLTQYQNIPKHMFTSSELMGLPVDSKNGDGKLISFAKALPSVLVGDKRILSIKYHMLRKKQDRSKLEKFGLRRSTVVEHSTRQPNVQGFEFSYSRCHWGPVL